MTDDGLLKNLVAVGWEKRNLLLTSHTETPKHCRYAAHFNEDGQEGAILGNFFAASL